MRIGDLKRAIAKLPDEAWVNFYADEADEFTVMCATYNPVLRVMVLAADDKEVGASERILYNANSGGPQP